MRAQDTKSVGACRLPRLVALLLLCGPAVHASPNPCETIPDGTPCTGECISAGHCEADVCVAEAFARDGTRCPSLERCVASVCVRGVCRPQAPLVCPSPDACHVGQCDPRAGCVLVSICLPDLRLSEPDLAVPPDLAAPLDLVVVVDLASGIDLVEPSDREDRIDQGGAIDLVAASDQAAPIDRLPVADGGEWIEFATARDLAAVARDGLKANEAGEVADAGVVAPDARAQFDLLATAESGSGIADAFPSDAAASSPGGWSVYPAPTTSGLVDGSSPPSLLYVRGSILGCRVAGARASSGGGAGAGLLLLAGGLGCALARRRRAQAGALALRRRREPPWSG